MGGCVAVGVNDGTGVDVRVWGAWVVAVAGIGVAYFLVAVGEITISVAVGVRAAGGVPGSVWVGCVAVGVGAIPLPSADSVKTSEGSADSSGGF